MHYHARITDFNFMPMDDTVPSILSITVNIPSREATHTFDEKGTINFLSQKFKFTMEDERNWNFAGFKGRKCIVRNFESGYRFVSFED